MITLRVKELLLAVTQLVCIGTTQEYSVPGDGTPSLPFLFLSLYAGGGVKHGA